MYPYTLRSRAPGPDPSLQALPVLASHQIMSNAYNIPKVPFTDKTYKCKRPALKNCQHPLGTQGIKGHSKPGTISATLTAFHTMHSCLVKIFYTKVNKSPSNLNRVRSLISLRPLRKLAGAMLGCCMARRAVSHQQQTTIS